MTSITTELSVNLLLLLSDISSKENSWREHFSMGIIPHVTTELEVNLFLINSAISRWENNEDSLFPKILLGVFSV